MEAGSTHHPNSHSPVIPLVLLTLDPIVAQQPVSTGKRIVLTLVDEGVSVDSVGKTWHSLSWRLMASGETGCPGQLTSAGASIP